MGLDRHGCQDCHIHLAIDYVTSSTHRSLSDKVSGMMDLICAENIEGTGQDRKCAKCNGKCPQNSDERNINKEFPDLVKTVLVLDKAKCLRPRSQGESSHLRFFSDSLPF